MRVAARRFTRHERLLSAREYRQVFDDPLRSSSSLVTVLARRNGVDRARLGLVVSKKCDKRAVGRNRIKRVIRESFRTHKKTLVGLDVIVIGRPCLPKRTNIELFVDLSRHWTTLARCISS